MWLITLIYALFASTFTAGKYTLQYIDPYVLTGVRMFLAGIILLTYQFVFTRSKLIKLRLTII